MADEVKPAMLDPKQAKVVADWTHERPLLSCRFDPLGRYVFAGAEDNTVQRWDIAAGTKVPLIGHESWVHAIAFSKDGAFTITGGCDGRLIWWPTAAEKPEPARKLDAHQGWIRAISVSADGTLLASGGNDLMIRVWNVADGALVKEFPAHDRHIYSLIFHPTQPILLSGDLIGALKQWDAANWQVMRAFEAKPLHSYNGGQQVDFGGVRALAVSPDNKHLAAGGLHKASNPLGAVHEPLCLLFSWESQQLLRSQIADSIPGGVLWRLCWLADGSLMGVTGGSSGGLLLFWKPDADKDYHRFALPSLARDMDLHPDGLRVATAHSDRHLRITRLAAPQA